MIENTSTLALIAFAFIGLVGLGLATVLFLRVSGPREPWDPDLESGTLSILGRRKDKLLRILKDLDDERKMGSIEEPEYLELRRSYKAKAVVAFREFQRVREARLRKLQAGKTHVDPDIRARIDRQVARRLRKSNPAEAS